MTALVVIGVIVSAVGVIYLIFFNRAGVNQPQLKEFIDKNKELEKEKKDLYTQLSNVREEKARLESDNKNLKNNIEERGKFLDSVKSEFENLTNTIYDEKTKKFKETSKEHMDNILNPLKSKIEDFKKDFGDKFTEEQKEIVSLKTQIKSFVDERKSLVDTTTKLTEALTSDPKKQGNWGELKLERILEYSGLEKDREYTMQAKGMGLKSDDGTHQLPDAVVFLPDKKHVIIDSKVNIKSYFDVINADSDTEEKLKELMLSVKDHVDNLHEKEYHLNEKLCSPEFTLLFFPQEGAFGLVMDMSVPNQNTTLLEYAWDKSIIIVTPSNLIATLRTIASLWRMDKQNKNVQAIVKESGNLYDKFVGFLDSMDSVKRNLKEATSAYDKAEDRLKEGRGNIINRLEKIKKLGAKSAKQIPEEWTDNTKQILEE